MPKRPMSDAEIEAARHVLYYYGHPGGYQPGSFTSHLMDSYTYADPGNRARLKRAFPEVCEAMEMVLHSSTGMKDLAARLES